MKKILILFVFFPAALLGMDKDMYFKKNSCNLGYFGVNLVESDNQCKNFSRYELFSGKKCIGSVAYNTTTCSLDFLYLLEGVRNKGLGTLLFFKAFEDFEVCRM